MEQPLLSLTALPNETGFLISKQILLTICNFLPSSAVYKCLQVNHALKSINQYILEHKRKVRFVDDNLRVIFVGLEESGKSSVVTRLKNAELAFQKTKYPKDRLVTLKCDLKQTTMSMRGRRQIITLVDPPTLRSERAQVWREAFAADLCVLVIGAFADKPIIAAEIEQLMLGTCHMMSSREVIVAINLGDYQPEKAYRQYKQEVTKILKSTIGPLFDVIPISVSENINISDRKNSYKWYKGLTLEQTIKRSQQQTNWNETAVDRLRSGKFEMQFYQKHLIRGPINIVSGLVTSGRLMNTEGSQPRVRITPTDQSTAIPSMQMRHEKVDTAEAGDIVALCMKIYQKDVRKKWGFAFEPSTDTIGITRAFRVKLFVVQQSKMEMKAFYRVYYGGSRLPCLLWWVLPDETFKKEGLKKARSVTAIMVPLVVLPMKVYTATEFQKNYHGKVMLTQRNTLVAVGRIDKVVNEVLPIDSLHPRQNRQNERYEYIAAHGSDLFKEGEAAMQAEFLAYIQTDAARKVLLQYYRNTYDIYNRAE